MATNYSLGEKIGRKFLSFSVFLFLAILVLGSVAFILFMHDTMYTNTSNELRYILAVERVKMEASVNSEIDVVLKISNSPLIQKYLTDPSDEKLAQEALDEFYAYRLAFIGKTLFWVSNTDKKLYFDSAYAYTVDPEDPKDYWYNMTLLETEKYNFNINYNPDLKNINLWINVPVYDGPRKIDRAPKPIGAIGSSVDLSFFIDSIYKNYSGSAALYFFNSAGEITGASDARLAANKILIAEFLGNAGKELNNRAKNLFTSHVQIFASEDKVVALGLVPALGWYIAAVQPFSITDYLDTNATLFFYAVILVIAFVFVLFNIVLRYLFSKSKFNG